ncbi:unnamed protein product, partial [Dovyalis caffra]
ATYFLILKGLEDEGLDQKEQCVVGKDHYKTSAYPKEQITSPFSSRPQSAYRLTFVRVDTYQVNKNHKAIKNLARKAKSQDPNFKRKRHAI